MYQLVLILHMLAAACIIGLVLIQQGKGAMVGSAFGSGASQTVFGSRGAGSVLLKITLSFVAVFFMTSIALNYMASQSVKQTSQVELPPATTTLPVELPVTPSSIPTNTAPAK